MFDPPVSTPNPAHDPPRRVAHPLILLVGECQRRSHGDAVPGVHTHRVDVLNRAHDHEVIGDVAHHLELELLPADAGTFLDEDFVHRTQIDPAGDDLPELLDVVRDAPPHPAQRERRPDDRGEPQSLLDNAQGLVDRLRVRTTPAPRCRSTAIASRNFKRSSATMMASIEAPISDTPNSSRVHPTVCRAPPPDSAPFVHQRSATTHRFRSRSITEPGPPPRSAARCRCGPPPRGRS